MTKPPEWMQEEDKALEAKRSNGNTSKHPLDEMAERMGGEVKLVAGEGKPSTWRAKVIVGSKDGKPAGLPYNASLILTNDVKWKGKIGYDERGDRIVWMRPPGREFIEVRAGDDITRTHAAIMRGYMLTEHGLAIRDPDMWSGVCAAAMANPYNRLQEWLRSIVWDGEARLTGWLQRYCAAGPSELTENLGRKWLIAAVARAISPGCQADNTLTLIGGQGVGKTTTLRILGGEFFKSGLGDMGSKDARIGLQGAWIIEIGEFGSFKGRSVDQVKDFITQTIDIYRPPYGKDQVTRRRGCVFAATTNNDAFFSDPTGARRFWTVEVGNCDTEALKEDRDQLIAEAVAAYESGEQWHATREQEISLNEHNKAHDEEDPWMERICDILSVTTSDFVTTHYILAKIGFDHDKMTQRDAKRLSACMKKTEWVPHRTRLLRGYKRPGAVI